ncbi:hypothetical protein J2S08_002166 [Bacillus chungangensis]|uniref:Uncharacterized protein n=1 Tax=Bacillus chungangensis TaxID=587633 RepID=A0ABT9WT89_9BACI|nr:hypothetical protein [Bacillus chungangensis]
MGAEILKTSMRLIMKSHKYEEDCEVFLEVFSPYTNTNCSEET